MSGDINTSSSLAPPSRLSGEIAIVFSAISYGPSGAPALQISQDEYDRLRLLLFSQTGYSLTHTSSFSIDAYIVSLQTLDIRFKRLISYDRLYLSNQFSSVNIVDST